MPFHITLRLDSTNPSRDHILLNYLHLYGARSRDHPPPSLVQPMLPRVRAISQGKCNRTSRTELDSNVFRAAGSRPVGAGAMVPLTQNRSGGHEHWLSERSCGV